MVNILYNGISCKNEPEVDLSKPEPENKQNLLEEPSEERIKQVAEIVPEPEPEKQKIMKEIKKEVELFFSKIL